MTNGRSSSVRTPTARGRRRRAAGLAEHEVAQHAAEGLLEVRLGEDLLGRAVGEHGALEQHGAVAELRHAAEIVGRDQHDPALVAERAEQGDDRLLGLDVDAGEGLVEQDHAAVLRQRAGEEDALLLAAGQFADLALAEVAHADAGERGVDRGAVAGRRRCAGSPCGRSGPSSPRPRPAPGSSSRPPRPAAHRRRGSASSASLDRHAEDRDRPARQPARSP